MGRLRVLLQKLINRETILYVVFGVLTTVINIVVFALCSQFFHLSWELGNGIAWVLSVLFAFITNKLFVFESKSFRLRTFFWEIGSFFAARLFSLAVEYVGMWLLIDVLAAGEMLSKILMNVVVIILNYILSKLIIFKKNAQTEK